MRSLVWVIAACPLMVVSAAHAAALSSALLQRVAQDGSAAVVVMLREPPPIAGPRGRTMARQALARTQAAVLAALPPGEVEVVHAYRTVPGFAARVSGAALARLAEQPDVLRIDVDAAGGGAIEDGIAQVRADRVQARGIMGRGTTIAVIDSGIRADHPDIADALVAEACFCRAGRIDSGGNRSRTRQACCPDGRAAQIGAGSAAPAYSHGPHVAGVALSRGRLGPIGVAPAAQLVAIRVLDEENEGFLSDWLAALDWLADQRPDVRIVNMSLVSFELFQGDCSGGDDASVRLLSAAVDRLWERGTVVFAAAGNEGRADVMTAPACIDRVIAVGAVDGNDAIASFSNGGPGLDLLGPGVDILSDGTTGIAMASGTSVATPHAAGAAALLLSARPSLSAADVERVLRDTGIRVWDGRTGRSTPRVDAFAALRAALHGAELERGSGSSRSDCLLEWSFVPPDIVSRRGWPLATCRDNDARCDSDDVLGQCTFTFSPCFNMPDPALPLCASDEPLQDFGIFSPAVNAAQGTLDRRNVDVLATALPDFPFASTGSCSAAIPFVVARPTADRAGRADIRMAVGTPTRRDYDHIVLRCLPP